MRTLDHRKWGEGICATYMLWCFRHTHLPEPHDHTFYELFWVQSGQGQYWINGKIETLKTGDLVLVRPEDAHSFAAAKGGEFFEFVNVAFPPEIWKVMQKQYFKGRNSYFGILDPATRRHNLNAAQLLRVGSMASGLRAGMRSRLSVQAFLIGLLSMLEEPARKPNTSEIPNWLSLAVDQIKQYPNFAGGTAALARLAGRSPEHVARECRRCFGRKPNVLVNEARMEYAARELQMERRTILDIALDCGIENLGHFYQLFKKRYGLAPAAYRDQFGHKTYA